MTERHVILSEQTQFGGESGAALMRNRCAFTSRDMAAGWAEAFTYAIVSGWDADDAEDTEDAMAEVAEKYGWDADLIAFLRDAHERFEQLPDRINTNQEEN